MYTHHIGGNGEGYSLGDSVKLNTWLQRSLGPAATWLRLAYSNTDHINGRDPEINRSLTLAPSPDADPNNYGGQRIDGFLGASIAWRGFSVGVEAGVPLFQNLNGLQLKNDWYLTAGARYMF